MSEKIRVCFYLNDEKFAFRVLEHVPNLKDEVRFQGVVYVVTKRVFCFDDQFDGYLNIDIKPVKK